MKITYNQRGITIFESSLYQTTSTLIELGNALLIVDPNLLPVEIDFITDYIKAHYFAHATYVLFTHSDFDHIIGFGAFPDAVIIASEPFLHNKDKEIILKQINKFDNEYYITRNYKISYPHVDIVIKDETETIEINGHKLILYQAPGHVRDALFVIIPSKHCFIAGDYVSMIEIPFIDYQYKAYVKTLDKAKQILESFDDIEILIVGHGPYSTDRNDMFKRIENDGLYLSLVLEIATSPSKENKQKVRTLIHAYSDNPVMLQAHKKNVKQVLKEITA